PPLRLGTISSRSGGRIGRHGSHQNGLDADVYFYRKTPHASAWSPEDEGYDSFDFERNWHFLLSLHSMSQGEGQPRDDWGILIAFVDPPIKNAFCEWLDKEGKMPTDPNAMEYRALKFLRTYYITGSRDVSSHDDHY